MLSSGTTQIAPPSPTASSRITSAFILASCLFAILCWQRNHDILQDLYDYSTVIAAAGKIEAGLRPYVDVRSPMQSATYFFNWAAERVFGAHYLGLTLGGLVQTLLGGAMVTLVLWRAAGRAMAVMLGTAVMLAGPAQHVVFFYNTIGIVSLAVVVLGLAQAPVLWRFRSPVTVAVWLALIVGGTNKLNFHGVGLILGGVLLLQATAGRRMDGRTLVGNLTLLALGGLAAPLALELSWTGATFAQWWADVVLLPESRVAALWEIFSLRIYATPAHAAHHHLLLESLGGWGLALLLTTGAWTSFSGWRERLHWSELAGRALFVLLAALAGALLMVSNAETVVLTSLLYLIAAAALWLVSRPASREQPGLAVLLLAASGVWTVCGGYAAWHGSRVLYGIEAPDRARFIRVDDTQPALAYFNGVRLEAETHQALHRVATRLTELEQRPGQLHGVILGSSLEWLERAYPTAMLRGTPIWYHAGTTLRDGDLDWFRSLLSAGAVRRIVTHVGWQAWPDSITQVLQENYRREFVGSQFVIYHPRHDMPPSPPRRAVPRDTAHEFRHLTGSNVLLGATTFPSDMRLLAFGRNHIFGRRGSSAWNWPFGTRVFSGQAAARLAAGSEVTEVVFRILAQDNETPRLLWEQPVLLTPGRPARTVPFSLHANSRPLLLEVSVPPEAGRSVMAGWKQIRITHAGDLNPRPALPFDGNLEMVPPQDEKAQGTTYWFARSPSARTANNAVRLPAEFWRLHPAGEGSIITVKLDCTPAPGSFSSPVSLTLSWYRSGRFEIMTQRVIDPAKESIITLEGHLAEPDGWIGVHAHAVDAHGGGAPTMRIISIQTR